MRINIFFIAVAAITMSLYTNAQSFNYRIKGKIGKLNSPAKAYLLMGEEIDSAVIRKGSFDFSGTVKEPRAATLLINKQGTGIYSGQIGPNVFPLRFYVEPTTVHIKSPDSINNATITAGPLNADYQKLKIQLASTEDARKRLAEFVLSASAETNKTDSFTSTFQQQLAAIGEKQKLIFLQFIKENPRSLMSLLVIKCYGGFDYSMLANNMQVTPGISELETLIQSLAEEVKSNKMTIGFQQMLERLKRTEIGFMAIDFAQPDTTGQLVSLADFRGKYVLIDFWASWCAPCRAENPAVVRAFQKYKTKGFTVLGVSLDGINGKNAWLKAIKDDELTWTQVSDLKGWQNEAALLYGVTAIPQNFLIDPDGKIIGKNLRGDELEKTLQSYLADKKIKYVVNGEVGNLSYPAKAFLIHQDADSMRTDSSAIINGRFRFSGISTDKENVVYLVISKSGRQLDATNAKIIKFYTDSSIIKVIGSFIDDVVIVGGILNNDEAALTNVLAAVDKSKKLADEDNLSVEKKSVYRKFIESHTDSKISLKALSAMGGSTPDPADVEPLFNLLSPNIRLSKEGREYADKIAIWKKIAIGSVAPDFTLHDTSGKAVSFSQFRGQYVLLDFWASWCPPCRAENPNVKLAYSNYRDNNFTVVGITLDNPDKKAAWLQAIYEDGLPWVQLGSLKMWENIAATLYSVNTIPQNFLINPEGVIIAKNLRGDELNKTLKKIFLSNR